MLNFNQPSDLIEIKNVEKSRLMPDSSYPSLQRYKSISSGNLLDVTTNDKKTITENLKDKCEFFLYFICSFH